MKLSVFLLFIFGFSSIGYTEQNDFYSRSLVFQNIDTLNFPNQYSENCDGIYCYQITPNVIVDSFSINFYSKDGEKMFEFKVNQMETDKISHNIELLLKKNINMEGVYYFTVDYKLNSSEFMYKGFINIFK